MDNKHKKDEEGFSFGEVLIILIIFFGLLTMVLKVGADLCEAVGK